MPLEAGLLEILACPACHAPLREEQPAAAADAAGPGSGGSGEGAGEGSGGEGSGGELVCTGGADCGLAYPIRDDIPVLLVDEARRPV